jgi:hypothetical protein
MSNTTDDNMPVTFPEKWAKALSKMPEFKEMADSASAEDLKKMVVTCEGNIYTIEKEKDADAKLNSAQELVKEFSEPYRDAIKAQTVKLKYAMFLLEGKGVNLDNND